MEAVYTQASNLTFLGLTVCGLEGGFSEILLWWSVNLWFQNSILFGHRPHYVQGCPNIFFLCLHPPGHTWLNLRLPSPAAQTASTFHSIQGFPVSHGWFGKAAFFLMLLDQLKQELIIYLRRDGASWVNAAQGCWSLLRSEDEKKQWQQQQILRELT